MRRRLFLAGGFTAAVLLLTAGCAGYRLGPTNGMSAGSRAVQVNLFVNRTAEPRLAEPVARALRLQLQQDGTFRLATQNDSDLLVDGVLTSFDRQPLSFNPTDVVTTRDYDARLTAQIRVTERGTGRVVLEREVTGRTIIQGQADLPSAERQSAPLLAEDLARNITALLVDGRW